MSLISSRFIIYTTSKEFPRFPDFPSSEFSLLSAGRSVNTITMSFYDTDSPKLLSGSFIHENERERARQKQTSPYDKPTTTEGEFPSDTEISLRFSCALSRSSRGKFPQTESLQNEHKRTENVLCIHVVLFANMWEFYF